MSDSREHWYEDEAGPLVRLYAVTRGRGRAQRPDLDLTTLVVDAGYASMLRRPEPEYAALLRLCRGPLSVAEVAAHMGLPLTLTRVLVGDLVDDGLLTCRSQPPVADHAFDTGLLHAVLEGIRSL